MVSALKFHLHCFLLLSLSLCGQEEFLHFSSENGLPSSQTFDIMQDRKGFIWIATDAGVSRYNSYRFENFTLDDGLPDNTVLNIFEDEKGHIWFSSFSGKLCYYDYSLSRIVKYRFNDTLDKYLPGQKYFRTMHFTKEGALVLGYLGKGKIQIDNKGKFSLCPVANTFKDNYYYLEHLNGGILSYSKHYATTFSADSIGVVIKIGGIDTAVLIKRYTNLLNNIVALQRKNGNLLLYVPGYVLESSTNNKLLQTELSDEIYRFYEDDENHLWVCMKNGGLRRYDTGSSFFAGKYTTVINATSVANVFKDNAGGTWVSTLNEGIYYSPKYSLSVKKIKGLPVEKKVSILEISGKMLLTAINDDKLFSIEKDSVSHSWPLPPGRVTAISEFKNNVILSCESLYLSNEKMEWKKIFPQFGQRKTSYAYSFLTSDSFILSGNHGVLVELSAQPPYTEKNLLVLGNSDVLKLIAYNNKIIAGTTNGIFCYEQGKLKPFKLNESSPTWKASEMKEFRGRLVISTFGHGLKILDKNKISSLTVREGLLSNNINSFDIYGNSLWLASNSGINEVKFTNDSFLVSNYTIANGLPVNEIKKLRIFNNTLYFLTGKGIFNFPLNTTTIKNVELPVMITRVHTNDTNYTGTAISFVQEIGYNRNVVIDFIGLDFRQKGNIEYCYRLIGSDTNWRSTRNTYVEFSFLSSGDYRFEIKAKNENGTWNAQPVVFSFYVSPPFWKTAWFVVSLIFLLVTIISSIFLNRIYQLKKINRQKEQILEYRHKALIAQINPHFIFNSLNSIYAFILTENKRSAAKYLSMFSKLMRLSLDNSMSDYVPLSKDLEALQLYIDLEALRFKNNFSFSIKLNAGIDAESILVPSMLIQPFVENSIRHGLIHKKDEGGQLTVKISRTGGNLLCEVEDNGIGREQSALLKKDPEHQSAGTQITMQRLMTSIEKLRLHYYLEYIDKKNPTGTTVRFFLPHILKHKKDESSNY